MKAKRSFFESVTSFTESKLAPVLGKFAQNKVIRSISTGMMGTITILVGGSLFLLVFAFGSAYFPFLQSVGALALNGFYLTMSIIGLYVAYAISSAYAKEYELDVMQTAILGIAAFLLLTVTVQDGNISVGAIGATAVFPAIISSLIAGTIIRFCRDKHITIKMPAGVPPAIEATFAFLIPGIIILVLAWLVRSVLGVDITSLVSKLLAPLFKGVDNIWVYTFRWFFGSLLWSVGIHAESIIGTITNPLTTQWIADNASNVLAGIPMTHIWTQGLERLTVNVAPYLGLLFWVIKSKAKEARTIGIASFLPVFFTIGEPILFGLPIVLNPYLTIPFILSGTIGAFFLYGVTALGLFSEFYITLPWMTPSIFQAVLGTGGDLRGLLVFLGALLIGVLIYAPFWLAYEKTLLVSERKK